MANQLENIAGLQSILETVNSLPDAGSGGGGTPETCTVNVNWVASDGATTQYQSEGNPVIAYCDADGALNTVSAKASYPIINPNWSVVLTCMCGSLLCFTQGTRTTRGIASASASQEITNLVTLPAIVAATDVICLLPKTAGTYEINIYYG